MVTARKTRRRNSCCQDSSEIRGCISEHTAGPGPPGCKAPHARSCVLMRASACWTLGGRLPRHGGHSTSERPRAPLHRDPAGAGLARLRRATVPRPCPAGPRPSERTRRRRSGRPPAPRSGPAVPTIHPGSLSLKPGPWAGSPLHFKDRQARNGRSSLRTRPIGAACRRNLETAQDPAAFNTAAQAEGTVMAADLPVKCHSSRSRSLRVDSRQGRDSPERKQPARRMPRECDAAVGQA
jgi:hypothetical protein